MIAVTGALRVFSRLPGAIAGSSLAFASGVRRKTMRAGQQLTLVGPHFSRSYSSRSVASLTGLSSQALWVRALRNSRSRPSSFRIELIAVSSWVGL